MELGAILVGALIGLLIGWNTPEPIIFKTLQTKVWGLFVHPAELTPPVEPPVS